MSDFDHGPLNRYEVTWANGHVEIVEAHQCMMPRGSMFGDVTTKPRWAFHGEIDGRWQLILTATDEQIHSVRNASVGERIGGDDA